MAGAISGARLGIAAIPQRPIARLETGTAGRDHINVLAQTLHARWANPRQPN